MLLHGCILSCTAQQFIINMLFLCSWRSLTTIVLGKRWPVNIKLLASRLLTTLSLTHPWVQTSYNGSISLNFDCTRLFTEVEHLRGPEHLRTCENIPGGTFTLADMFRGNVSASEYVPPERFRAGTNPLWHRLTRLNKYSLIFCDQWWISRVIRTMARELHTTKLILEWSNRCPFHRLRAQQIKPW